MKITSREAYVLGWVFGRISGESTGKEIGGPVEWAAQRPFSGLAKVLSEAHQIGSIKPDLNAQIAEALDEITHTPDEPEEVQPLEIQGSWELGYYAGKSGRPLAGAFDISQARKTKGMTQTQLADIIGVDQALVSRWESGKVSPNKANLQKLRDALR